MTPPPFDYAQQQQGMAAATGMHQVVVGARGAPPSYEGYDGHASSTSSFGSFAEEDYYTAARASAGGPALGGSGTSTPRSRTSTPFRHDPYSAEGYVLEPAAVVGGVTNGVAIVDTTAAPSA